MDSPKSTRELLEKYWAAETTTAEEATLRKRLQDEDSGVLNAYARFLEEESAGFCKRRSSRYGVRGYLHSGAHSVLQQQSWC